MSDLQTILLDCEYFPCIEWYRQFVRSENRVIETQEYFQRATLRNRCYVAGPNGRLALSVPLEGGRNQRSYMYDIRVSNGVKWQAQHWKTIQACYGRSPYFPYFEDSLVRIFTKQYEFLVDLNLDSIELINRLLSVKNECTVTASYQKEYPDSVNDFRNAFDTETCTPDDIHYLQPFEDKNGFVSGLSMLDMLMCAGKQSLRLLH